MVEYTGREVLLKDQNGEVIIPYVEKPDLSEYAKSSDVTSAINSLDAEVVKLSGDQTIAGTKTFSSAVKCAGSATTGTAITTTAISKSGNGYVKLGNGIIICWGSVAGGSSVTVTFPTSFTATPRVSSSTTQGEGGGYERVIVSITKTGFTSKGRGGAADYTSHYIAIGY